MKHATEETLNSHSRLLSELNLISELKEKKLGVYYKRSKAFLHFHEDQGELFADVRLDGSDFERLPASSAVDQKNLLTRIKKCLR